MGRQQLTTESFITKAISVHGNRYDYSKVVYVNNTTKIDIVCSIHGNFLCSPANHLRGRGCCKCGRLSTASKRKTPYEDLLQKFHKIHGNKYDYSKVVYTNTQEKIIILCKKHGAFHQTPNKHLQGRGCPMCKTKTTSEIITQFRQIHFNKYDYSKTQYRNAKTKICIICKEHGEFWQTPSDHLKGRGCPMCSTSKGELYITIFLNNIGESYFPLKTFNDLKYVKALRFDFYLPKRNTIIEFQGIQHYESVEHFGGDEYLKVLQCRDAIKEQYCKEKGIRLIRIPYWKMNYIDQELKLLLVDHPAEDFSI